MFYEILHWNINTYVCIITWNEMDPLFHVQSLNEIPSLAGGETDSSWGRITSVFPLTDSPNIMKDWIVYFLASNTKRRWSGAWEESPLELNLSNWKSCHTVYINACSGSMEKTKNLSSNPDRALLCQAGTLGPVISQPWNAECRKSNLVSRWHHEMVNSPCST